MEKPHSGIGIASFILALLMWSGFVALAIAAMVTSGGSAINMGLGLGLLVDALIGLLASLLGVVTLFQSERKKVFGVLGLVLSVLAILFLVALTAFGKWA